MKHKVNIGALYLVMAASLWGASQVVSKSLMINIQPMTLTLLRFIMALTVLGMIAAMKGVLKIDVKDAWRLALLGLLGYTLSIGSQLLGIKLTTVHIGTLITSTPPIFMMLLSIMFYHEKVTLKNMTALSLSGIGVFLTVGIGQGDGGTLIGNLLLIIAAVSWALYSVWGKTLTVKYNSLTVTFWSLFFGTLFTIPFFGWEMTVQNFTLQIHPSDWISIGYVGVIATAAGFYLWNKGLETFGSSVAGLFLFVQPLVGSLLALVFLNEHIQPIFYLSSILVVIGIGLALINIDKSYKLKRFKSLS